MSEWKLITGIVAAKTILTVGEFLLAVVILGIVWWMMKGRS